MSDSDEDDTLSYKPFSRGGNRAKIPRKQRHQQPPDDSSSTDNDDDDLEEPYTQNLDFLGKPDELDEDENDGILPLGKEDDKAKEPLRPGDVISYCHPVYTAGDPRGNREATVLATDPSGEIVLDNADCLPSDWQIKRIKVRTRKNELEDHPGVYRPIDCFKLTKQKLNENSDLRAGIEMESKRIGNILQRNISKFQTKVKESGCGPIDVFQSFKGSRQNGSDQDNREASPSRKRSRVVAVDLSKSSSSSSSEADSDSSSSVDFAMISKKRSLAGQTNKKRMGSQWQDAKRRNDDSDDDSFVESPRKERYVSSSARNGSVRRKRLKPVGSARKRPLSSNKQSFSTRNSPLPSKKKFMLSSSSSDSESDVDNTIQRKAFLKRPGVRVKSKGKPSSMPVLPRNRLYQSPPTRGSTTNFSDSECSGMSIGTTDHEEPAERVPSHLPTPLNIQTVRKKISKSPLTTRKESTPSERHRKERTPGKKRKASPPSNPGRNEHTFRTKKKATAPGEPGYKRSQLAAAIKSPPATANGLSLSKANVKKTLKESVRFPRVSFGNDDDDDYTSSAFDEQRTLSWFSKDSEKKRSAESARTSSLQTSDSDSDDEQSIGARWRSRHNPTSSKKIDGGIGTSSPRMNRTKDVRSRPKSPSHVSSATVTAQYDSDSIWSDQELDSVRDEQQSTRLGGPRRHNSRSSTDSGGVIASRSTSRANRKSTTVARGTSSKRRRSPHSAKSAKTPRLESDSDGVVDLTPDNDIVERIKSRQASKAVADSSRITLHITPMNTTSPAGRVSSNMRKLRVEDPQQRRGINKDRVGTIGVSRQTSASNPEEGKENNKRSDSRKKSESAKTNRTGDTKGTKRSVCDLESGSELVDSADDSIDLKNTQTTKKRLRRARPPPHPRYLQESSFDSEEDWISPSRIDAGKIIASSGSSRKREKKYGRWSNPTSSGSKKGTPRNGFRNPSVVVLPGSSFSRHNS